MAAVWDEMRERGVTWAVCLAPLDEVELKSRDYARAIAEESTPVPIRQMPIADFGVPTDSAGFWTLVVDIAEALKRAESVLVHCAGGIGRTGLMASAVLLALGHTHEQAAEVLAGSGSKPETHKQVAFLRTLPPG